MMDEGKIAELAHEYGTPTYVFDLGAFQERLRAVGDVMGPDIALCYAMKANPFLLSAASEVVERLEVCSPGELDICKTLEVDPSKIVFSGVNKTPESVRDAADYRVGVMTAESHKHVALIQDEGARRGEVIDVLLRLNAGSQFGMSRDDLLAVIARREELANINIVGVHYFADTQRKKIKHHREELKMLEGLLDQLKSQYGFTVQRLEYGPGLGVPLFATDDFSDTLALARELVEELRTLAAQTQVTVEMGRFFAAECGMYLTAVNDLKSNEGTNYCIVDGGINHLTFPGQIMGMKTPVVKNISACVRGAADEPVEWCVCGSLCANADVLSRGVDLVDLRIGDVLAFSNCGAYSVTEGVYLFLSRTMPRIMLSNADGSLVMARDFMETSPLNTIRNM